MSRGRCRLGYGLGGLGDRCRYGSRTLRGKGGLSVGWGWVGGKAGRGHCGQDGDGGIDGGADRGKCRFGGLGGAWSVAAGEEATTEDGGYEEASDYEHQAAETKHYLAGGGEATTLGLGRAITFVIVVSVLIFVGVFVIVRVGGGLRGLLRLLRVAQRFIFPYMDLPVECGSRGGHFSTEAGGGSVGIGQRPATAGAFYVCVRQFFQAGVEYAVGVGALFHTSTEL